MATPNMNLTTSTPLVTGGPAWAQTIENNLLVLDTHDHSSGKGVPIPSSGLLIVSDLSFGQAFAKDLKGSKYFSQAGAFGAGEQNAVYVVNGNLYFNNGSGVAVQVTAGAGVNVAGSGGITGLSGTTAALTYSDILKTFIFTQSSGISAHIDAGKIAIREAVSSGKAITLQAPASLANDYDLVLPAAQSGAGQIPSNNGSGVLSWQPANLINFLLNSNFDLWTRGTSTTIANGATGYQADRWYVKNSLGTNGVITFSRDTSPPDGSKYAAKVQITTAPTASHANGTELYQTIENLQSLELYNKTASFSIQVKALNNVNQVGVQFFYKTTEAKVDTSIGSEQTIAVTTGGWATATINGQALGTSMTSSGVIGVRIRITGVSSGDLWALNNGFLVSQGMLNLGSLPSPYRRALPQMALETTACERFYQEGVASAGSETDGSNVGAREIYVPVNFTTTMRVAPTLDIATTIVADVNAQTPQAQNSQTTGFRMYLVRNNAGGYNVMRRYKADAEI